MRKPLSTKVADWLISTSTIKPDERELYEYAVSCFLTTISPILLVLCIGAFFGLIPESIILILPFIAIRKFSGGVHAKSPVICFVCSACLLSALILMTQKLNISLTLTLIMVFCSISLILFSPVDSENKPLSANEKKIYRFIAMIISLFFDFTYLLLLQCNLRHYAVCIALGLILAAALQYPCVIKKYLTLYVSH